MEEEYESRRVQDVATLNPFSHVGGTDSLNGMLEYQRIPSSDMHLGKFLNSLGFQSWKVNFKTEVCANSAVPHITAHWIKEVEIAKSIDDLLTSQSITGRRDFTDDEMLDAKMASPLQKIITSVSKCRRASCSERRPILTRKAECSHDLRTLSGHWSS